eukprot:COSAG03_NODE_1339_length_4295_cov_11.594852_2_plen_156_part_00
MSKIDGARTWACVAVCICVRARARVCVCTCRISSSRRLRARSWREAVRESQSPSSTCAVFSLSSLLACIESSFSRWAAERFGFESNFLYNSTETVRSTVSSPSSCGGARSNERAHGLFGVYGEVTGSGASVKRLIEESKRGRGRAAPGAQAAARG